MCDSTPVQTTALRGAFTFMAPIPRARARGARRRRRNFFLADPFLAIFRLRANAAARARRWCATAPRFNNCVEGAYGIARFAEREAVESDGHARSTCGVRELRDAPVRRSVGQRAAAARRPTSIVCWWQSGDAGGAEDRRRAPAPPRPPRGSVRPTRHSPPHGDIADDDVAAAAAAVCDIAPRFNNCVEWALMALARFAQREAVESDGQRAPTSPPHARQRCRRLAAARLRLVAAAECVARLLAERPLQGRRLAFMAPSPPRALRERARRWRRELGRWCATAPRFNNCVEGAYGIARFAQREAVESDGHARSTCGVRELRDAPVRRSVGQRAAAARRPTSIVCWWQRAMLAAPRIGRRRRALRRSRPAAPAGRRCAHFVSTARATARQRATNTTLAATRRHPRRATAQQWATNTPLAATRRHTATSVSSLDGGC